MTGGIALDSLSTTLAPNKRVNYAFGMLLGVTEFQQEQEHFEWKHRLGNLLLHGSGTVCGLQVSAEPLADDVVIRISPGYAISPQGRWIWVEREQCGRLNEWLQQHWRDLSPSLGLGPHTVYATLCYDQCLTDLVPIATRACALDEDSRAPSRVLETFKLQFAWQAPSQVAEEAARGFGNLLRRIEIVHGSAPAAGVPDDSAYFIEQVRNLGLALSPPPTLEFIQLWAATACETLRQALAVWVTEVCPRLQATAEESVLLVAIQFSVDANGNLLPGSVGVADSARPVLVSDRLKQELFCFRPASAAAVKRIPYISTWLVLGPIFDPAHQLGEHSINDPYPRAGDIIRDLDNHKEQLDPVALTQALVSAPASGDLVWYGGQGADGRTIFSRRIYSWRKRYFGDLDWESPSDIGDNLHNHISGDYVGDDPYDPWNYLNFAGKHHALGLFFVYILSPDERDTRLRIRHDDAVRVWLNGKEVREGHLLPFMADHDVIDESETCAPITLQRGNNRLLVAVAETHVEWGLSVRIEDYEDLRIATTLPDRDTLEPSRSEYHFIVIAGAANGWNPWDPHRTLFRIGGRRWKGRVTLLNEPFKFVADGNWNRRNWGADGRHNGPNFAPVAAGVYELIFDEDQPQNPVFILVKPVS